MSLVKLLVKPITGRKYPLVFLGDGNTAETTFMESWDSLTNHGERNPSQVKFDKVNLYNAVRGYLDEQGVNYKPQGKISNDFLLRLDEDKDVRTLVQFLAEVKKYDELEAKIHSGDEEKEIVEFRAKLGKYASKYR
jgi:hypothetical protein